MSDSIDRVFSKAISTIQTLSARSGYGALPRPPAENRVKLYGLFKQATEGDVSVIIPRPYGFSQQDEIAKKKWDAWKSQEGVTKTEAKRRYIQYLIETMRSYAMGTTEARELLSELEFVWDQIKDLSTTPSVEGYISRRTSTGSVIQRKLSSQKRDLVLEALGKKPRDEEDDFDKVKRVLGRWLIRSGKLIARCGWKFSIRVLKYLVVLLCVLRLLRNRAVEIDFTESLQISDAPTGNDSWLANTVVQLMLFINRVGRLNLQKVYLQVT